MDGNNPNAAPLSHSMEEVLQCLAETLKPEEDQTYDLCWSQSHQRSASYVSCIKMDGRPILPPVMTSSVRAEMSMYRRQAVMIEAEIKARAREQLLSKVQNVLDSIQVKKTSDSTLDIGVTEEDLILHLLDAPEDDSDDSDVASNEDNEALYDINIANADTLPVETQGIMQNVGAMALPDDQQVSDEVTLQDPHDNDTLCANIRRQAGVPPILIDTKSPQRIAQAKARSPQLGSDNGETPSLLAADDSAIDSPLVGSPRDAAQVAVKSPRSEQSKVTGDSGISSRAPTATPAIPSQEEILDTMEEITDISEDEQTESLPMDGGQVPPVGIPPPGPSAGSYSKLAQALKSHLSLRKALSSQVSLSSTSTAASSEELNRTVLARPADDTTAAGASCTEMAVNVLRHPREQQELEAEDNSPRDESETTVMENTAVVAAEEPYAIIEISSPQNVSVSSHETQTDQDEGIDDVGLSLLSRVEFNDHDGSHSEDNLSHDKPEDGTAFQDTDGLVTPGPLVTPDVSQIIVTGGDSSPLLDDSLSCISSVPSKSTAIGAGLGKHVNSSDWQDVMGHSLDTCTPFTCSTDLGRYMVTSLDTIQSSNTTLPAASMDQATPVPQPQHTKSTAASIDQATPVPQPQQTKSTAEPQDVTDKAGPYDKSANAKDDTLQKKSRQTHGKIAALRGSYTVEHPSFCEADLNHVGSAEYRDKGSKPQSSNTVLSVKEVDQHNTQQNSEVVTSGEAMTVPSDKPMRRVGSYTIEKPFSEEPFSDEPPISTPTSKTHVRRGSYTLEHPSPALLQSTTRSQSTNETTPNSTPRSQPGSAPVDVTNSIEDLKTKPVQRRLDYGQAAAVPPPPVSPGAVSSKSSIKSPKASPPVHCGHGPVLALKGESEKAKQVKALASQPVHLVMTHMRDEHEVISTPSSEQEGKQEHLQRYLQTLSRMPPPNAESSPEPHTGLYYNADEVQTSPKSQGCLDMSKLSTVRHSHSSLGARHHHASSSSGGSDVVTASGRRAAPPSLRLRPECVDTATPSSMADGPSASVDQPSLTEEHLLHHQASYLEDLQQQLLRQQQEQLAQLLAEQQRQQLQLQQQLMVQSQQFLQQRSHSLGSTMSSAANTLPQLSSTLPNIDTQLGMGNGMQMPNPMLNNFLPPNSFTDSSKIYYEQDGYIRHMPVEAASKHLQPSAHRRPRQRKSAVSRSQESHQDTSHAEPSLHPDCVTSQELVSLALRVQAADDMDHLPAGLEADLSRLSAMDTQELVHLVANANISETVSSSLNSVRPMSAPAPRVHFSLGSEMHYYTPERGHSLHGQNSPVRHESPVIHKHRPSSRLSSNTQPLSEEALHYFARLPALVKGHLTRQLYRSNRVQGIINTITDTAYFALNLQQETPIKRGVYTVQDISLQERVLNQLTAAMYEFHEVFFDLSKREQMALIAQTRDMKLQQFLRERQETSHAREKQPLSTATVKAIERRKKAQEAEAAMLASMDTRPKSAPPGTSMHRKQTSKSADKSMTGALKRNYQHLMHRAMGHSIKHESSNKTNKENVNRTTTRLPTKQSAFSNKSLVKPKPIQGVATRKVQQPASTNIKRITCVQDAHSGASIRRVSHVLDKSKLSPTNVPWK